MVRYRERYHTIRLIQRGRGTGPAKPRQPRLCRCQIRQNPKQDLEDEGIESYYLSDQRGFFDDIEKKGACRINTDNTFLI
jgi:hypothetical protein